MELNEFGVTVIGNVVREEYIRLLAKHTGIEEEKLFKYAENNPIHHFMEYPESIDITSDQMEKLIDLRRWRQLFDSVNRFENKNVIRGPQDIMHYCSDLSNEQKEHFLLIILNTKNEIIKKITVSIGNLNSSIVHPREVFKEAIKYSAASVILVHNHPSGITKPSNTDIQVTKRLAEGGELLGIRVLDHIVIGKNGYTSMKEENLISDPGLCFEKAR
ncbi:MAG: DNA repair protein RadC [Eubacteriales bacterium]|nr:DNA repair protein RadC [Eubacteriales bacterium]